MNWTPASIVLAVSLGAIAHTCVLYPLALALTPRRRKSPPPEPKEWPRISVLISVYNEERHIGERIENLLALDYPPDKIDFLIGSDGSTDRTHEIVNACKDPRVRLYEFSPRQGKAGVLNDLIAPSTGDLLVFTDANTLFEPDAVRNLARHFADSRIGAVCGRLILHGNGTETSEGSYWELETFLKERESDLDSCLGANGGIYAIRRSAWHGIPDHTLVDDFVIAMRVREHGLRVIYAPEAVAREELPRSVDQEIRRRIRIGAGGYQAMILCWRSLLLWRGFHSFAFWSHKVLRWLSPFFMIAALITSLALSREPLFLGLFIVQAAFYALAAAGAIRTRRSFLLLRAPHYFVAMNLALLAGFFRFLTGRQPVTWERTTRS